MSARQADAKASRISKGLMVVPFLMKKQSSGWSRFGCSDLMVHSYLGMPVGCSRGFPERRLLRVGRDATENDREEP